MQAKLPRERKKELKLRLRRLKRLLNLTFKRLNNSQVQLVNWSNVAWVVSLGARELDIIQIWSSPLGSLGHRDAVSTNAIALSRIRGRGPVQAACGRLHHTTHVYLSERAELTLLCHSSSLQGADLLQCKCRASCEFHRGPWPPLLTSWCTHDSTGRRCQGDPQAGLRRREARAAFSGSSLVHLLVYTGSCQRYNLLLIFRSDFAQTRHSTTTPSRLHGGKTCTVRVTGLGTPFTRSRRTVSSRSER